MRINASIVAVAAANAPQAKETKKKGKKNKTKFYAGEIFNEVEAYYTFQEEFLVFV